MTDIKILNKINSLEKQQKDLEETQAFMYNLLLGEKDYEKIDQLNKHSKANTSYDFCVSEKAGNELRHLRDLKLIAMKSGYVSYLVRLSHDGKHPIDLTKYFDVTYLGIKFLETHEKLQSRSQQETENHQETPKVE